MTAVFKGYFPQTPYLKIEGDVRRKLWTDAFDDRPPRVPYADFDNTYPFAFSYRVINGYKDTPFVEQLIREGKLPEFLVSVPSLTPYEALNDEKVREKVFDPYTLHANLHLDFNYEDSVLIDRFKAMLKLVRGNAEPTVAGIGKKTSIKDGLRWLACSRLVEEHATRTKVESFLGRKNYKQPGRSQMYKARAAIAMWLQKRPIVPPEGKSVRPRR
jgi:hypothetical protein